MTGTELKEWRKAMGIDQREAASLFGVSYRTYQRYETLSNIGGPRALACIALWRKERIGNMPWVK